MNTVSDAITGSESINDSTTPFHALVEFYRGFNNRDIDRISANWAHSDQVSMSNPVGGIGRGWESIQAVYARIFTGPAQVHVEFHDYTIHQVGDMFCAVGRERGYFRLNDNQVDLAIRTSRIYRMDEGKWRQLHHHGSIDAPELLAEYQAAVLGQ